MADLTLEQLDALERVWVDKDYLGLCAPTMHTDTYRSLLSMARSCLTLRASLAAETKRRAEADNAIERSYNGWHADLCSYRMKYLARHGKEGT